MNRQKRLEKGIESIDEQIKKHRRKIDEYNGPKKYLKEYWMGEIERMKIRRENRKSKIKK